VQHMRRFAYGIVLMLLCAALALGMSPAPVEAQTVNFADSNLEVAIREAIGKPTGTIDGSDLQDLTELQATNRGISDLSGIQHCINLQQLWLGGNQIVSLQPLSSLTALQHLYLWDNLISSLTPLSGLGNLTILDVAQNHLDSLQPLMSLTSLSELGLEHNLISDLQPLAALSRLQMLGLSFNAITDLAPLAGLTELHYLSLWSNDIVHLQPLANLANLRFLDISANSISDLLPLAGLPLLQYLYAAQNSVSDLSPLSGLHSLDQIDLGHNMIADPSHLVANSGLDVDDVVILDRNWLVLGTDTSAGIAVQALRDRGVKVWCDDQLAPQPPSTPIALTAAIAATGHVTLSWTDASVDEHGFRLQRRSQNADGSWPAQWTSIASLSANQQTYSDETLTAKASYQYRVQAFNPAGSSYWATSQSLTVTPPIPTPPSHMTIWPVEDESALRVTWQDNSSNETSFKVERRRWLPEGAWSDWELRLWTAPNFTAFTDKEIPIGSSYQYRVRAVNSVGPSEWTISTGVRCEPTPLWPVNLNAFQSDPTDGVQLTWHDKSNYETGFEIHRRRQMDGPTWGDWEAVGWPSANTEQWDDLTTPQHGVYEYRIRAVNDHGASEWSPSAMVSALARPPRAPSSVELQAVDNSTAIRVTWHDSSDNETGFMLSRRRWLPTERWSDWEAQQSTDADVTSFIDNQISIGSSYQYRVRAVNHVGASEWTVSAAAVRCEPTPLWPVDLHAEGRNFGADILLTWRSKSDKETYLKVERRRQLGQVGVWSDWQTIVWMAGGVTQHLDDSVPGDGKYQYRVRVFNQTGPSEYSLPVTVWRLAVNPTALSVASVTAQQSGRHMSVVYTLSATAHVTLDMRNIAGRLVASLDCGQQSAGTHSAAWNLRNTSGAAVPPGLYVCTLTARRTDGSQATVVTSVAVQR